MKTIIKALMVAGVAAIAMGGTAAYAATASATAKAKILKQVTVTKSSDLEFGTVVTSTGPATVLISTAGTRTCGAGLVCSGTTAAAAFGIGGTTGQTVTISAPATVNLTSGAASMTATLLASAATRTLSGTAADQFSVGGSLAVGANQADGDYTGSFNVTVDYQ